MYYDYCSLTLRPPHQVIYAKWSLSMTFHITLLVFTNICLTHMTILIFAISTFVLQYIPSFNTFQDANSIESKVWHKSQIREQMSGSEISYYGKSILGCGLWPGLDRGKKGSGPILSNFFGCFFQFFMGKNKQTFFYIVASALKSCIKKKLKIF